MGARVVEASAWEWLIGSEAALSRQSELCCIWLFLRQNVVGLRLCSSKSVGEKAICRYSVPSDDQLHSSVVPLIEETKEKTKFVPNVMKVLARRPEEFNAFFKYYDVLMNSERGSLTKAEKELIVVATSAVNNCLYCVVSHSALHRIFSKNPYTADQVAVNPELAELTDRERAIVEFAINVAEMNEIDEDDFSTLARHGLDREDAWDIGAITAFFALSNRMAHLTAMMPNKEFHLMGRVPRVNDQK